MLPPCYPASKCLNGAFLTALQLIEKARNLLKRLGEWCRHTDLNRGPSDYKSDALPTELYRHIFKKCPLYTPEHSLNQR